MCIFFYIGAQMCTCVWKPLVSSSVALHYYLLDRFLTELGAHGIWLDWLIKKT